MMKDIKEEEEQTKVKGTGGLRPQNGRFLNQPLKKKKNKRLL